MSVESSIRVKRNALWRISHIGVYLLVMPCLIVIIGFYVWRTTANGSNRCSIATRFQMEQIGELLHLHYLDSGRFPQSVAECSLLIAKEIGDNADAWGQPFVYSVTTNNVMIRSYGPDKVLGTVDDITLRIERPYLGTTGRAASRQSTNELSRTEDKIKTER